MASAALAATLARTVLVAPPARAASDGTMDSAFTTNNGTGANGNVESVAVQADEKVILGGYITGSNGAAVGGVVRLNTDGTHDTAFTTNNGTGVDGNVRSVAVQANQSIILGGYITGWNGAAVGNLVRLDALGYRDVVFSTNVGSGAIGGPFGTKVLSVTVQADQRIIVGGDFTTWNGTTVGRIVRLGSAVAPTVSSVSPASGTAAGGTSVTITGTGFLSGATVTVGGSSCTSVVVTSSTSVACTTPAGTAGAQNVVVTNPAPSSLSGSGVGAFTYTSSGGGSGSSGGGSSSTPDPTPNAPVSTATPSSPVAVGGSAGTVNGIPVRTTFSVNPAGGVDIEANGATVGMTAVGADGSSRPMSGGGLGSPAGGDVRFRVSGFLPRSQVDVYLSSDPLWLGSAVVDAAGAVAMTVTTPARVQPGSHTLQFVGYQNASTVLTLSTGIEVTSPAHAAADTSQSAASSRAVYYFRPDARHLTRAAKAVLWISVNRVGHATTTAPVARTVKHRPPNGSRAGVLWRQRLAGITAFLKRAGCDTIATIAGNLTGVTGPQGQAALARTPSSRSSRSLPTTSPGVAGFKATRVRISASGELDHAPRRSGFLHPATTLACTRSLGPIADHWIVRSRAAGWLTACSTSSRS